MAQCYQKLCNIPNRVFIYKDYRGKSKLCNRKLYKAFTGKVVFLTKFLIDMINKCLMAAGLLMSAGALAQQYGGMWIPTEVNEKEMKSLGLKISAKDIFDANHASLKDAVVQFNGGCTAELISPKGLLLTNHHCGYGQIQAHSSVGHNYLADGFWAKNMAEELPNPGLTVDFITDIREVTPQILKGTEGLTGKALEEVITKNLATAKAAFPLANGQSVKIMPMYYGNKYYAFVTETFRDVRLVGAPPESIGKFGSDTDNWVWPRHTGDFSIFRIYADKNNRPADYSPDNIPYVPKKFLPVSIRDKKENDFTFVYGFPGRTQEYLPAIAVEKLMNETDPAMIAVRDVALKTLNEKMRTDEATKIKYASKYASVANYWKKWIGEVEGLKKSNAVARKQVYEQTLSAKNPAMKATLDELNRLYTAQAPYALNRAYYNEFVRNTETLTLAGIYAGFLRDYDAGKTTEASMKSLSSRLENFYKNYDYALDSKVAARLTALYVQKAKPEFLPAGMTSYNDALRNEPLMLQMAQNSIISGQKMVNGATPYTNLSQYLQDPKKLADALRNDPLFIHYTHLRDHYQQSTEMQVNDYQTQIDALQKTYMAQLMATDKDRKFFPDANSTLRVTYGVVKGSTPRDGVRYDYQTHLAGVIEKYVPGDYEFDVPQKLISLYNSKDYGVYKDAGGQMPLAFTATNHTTGGNSGSPAIDGSGNLVGLNFDRQWEGTMSDINYDPNFSRNIMVDTKYILFIIDKFAGARWLLDEMKIVK